MARGVNKVILVGNLGNDPETKYTQGGLAITTLSVATTNVRKDKDGQQIEKTEWHRVKLFGKLGEIAGEYLRKGSQCYLEGRIEYFLRGQIRRIDERLNERLRNFGQTGERLIEREATGVQKAKMLTRHESPPCGSVVRPAVSGLRKTALTG